MPDKNEELRVKRLTGGYLMAETKLVSNFTTCMVKQERAAETELAVAGHFLRWLGFGVDDVNNALAILEGNRG